MENSLHSYLQDLRRRSKLKLREVSSLSEIDQALLSKFEKGSRIPNEWQLSQLARVYGISYKDLKTQWLAEKVYQLLRDEEDPMDVMVAAEPRIRYLQRRVDAIGPVLLNEEIKNLLSKVDELSFILRRHRLEDGLQKQKMQEYFSIQYTYESNRIEGNTLSLGETMMVIKEGITISGKSINEHLEAINHNEAISLLYDLVKGGIAFDQKMLMQLHGLILRGIDRRNAGVFRTVDVRIAGSAHIPPQPFMLQKLMEDYFFFYSRNEHRLHPVILAAEMHERLVSIHPFIDGNGRTARLVMNLILLSHGFPIVILKGDYDSRIRYYSALEKVQTDGEPVHFYTLVINALLSSLEEHISLSKKG